MKIKSQRDFWSGLMFLVVGVMFSQSSIVVRNARPLSGKAKVDDDDNPD